MADYSADFLRRLLAAVDAFDGAFERWMETQQEIDHRVARGRLWTVAEKENQDREEVRNLELALAEAAGPASRAITVTGAGHSVRGVGIVDPVANWSLMSAPGALFTPRDVRLAVATARGRLGMLLDDAEAPSIARRPSFAPSEMHDVVWAAAAAHWTTHQYRVAVREAAEALNSHWKNVLGRNDVTETEFWQQTLSAGDPLPGRPKLVWPGDDRDKTTRSMRGGLLPISTRFMDHSGDRIRDPGMEFDERPS